MDSITSSLKNLQLLDSASTASRNRVGHSNFLSTRAPLENSEPRSLMSLCLGLLGQHLEDIVADLSDVAPSFPPDIKSAIVAIARRRKLLNDEILIAFADDSWDILDISGSDVSDFGLATVAKICRNVQAVDLSRCDKISACAVSDILSHCHSLETLRYGGCPRSNLTARRCLNFLKPKLKDIEEESWEELDSMDIVNGAPSLRWLIWPKIDDDSRETLATECPRICINPTPSPFGFRGIQVPREALPDTVLDDPIVKDIDPKTWAVCRAAPRIRTLDISSTPELTMAERFRLAFVERDERLAPKRAKNARQRQRRATKEWVMSNTDAKSVALASRANRFLHEHS